MKIGQPEGHQIERTNKVEVGSNCSMSHVPEGQHDSSQALVRV